VFPLKGIQILDFSRLLPGPLATQMLREQGAHIIKVERPDSPDYVRSQPPFQDGVSTLYKALNEAKTELKIDWTTKIGRENLLELVRTSDVLIEQFRPGVMAHWGLDYESLKTVNPQICYFSLTGYGQEGPSAKAAGHDLNYLAQSGTLDLNRDENGKPVIPGFQIADIAGGSYRLQMAVMAALLERARTGEGNYSDISMTDGMRPLLTFPLSQLKGGWNPKELRILSGGLVNYNVYETKDGKWMALGALELKFWNAFCAALDRKDWQREDLLALSIYQFPKEELEALFKERTREEWSLWAAEYDFCLTPVLELEELK
jgi:alpha-methylacyl-CoA racemase